MGDDIVETTFTAGLIPFRFFPRPPRQPLCLWGIFSSTCSKMLISGIVFISENRPVFRSTANNVFPRYKCSKYGRCVNSGVPLPNRVPNCRQTGRKARRISLTEALTCSPSGRSQSTSSRSYRSFRNWHTSEVEDGMKQTQGSTKVQRQYYAKNPFIRQLL